MNDIQLHRGDCLEVLRTLPDGCVDMVLCDLPYGTTQNKWDSVIPFEPLWAEYRRLCKGVVVLTASQPFTTDLISSNRVNFRYSLVWDKTKGGNFLTARKRPMKSHEDILVFGDISVYNPQMVIRGKPRKKGGGLASTNFGTVPTESFNNEYYPTSILTFSTGSRKDHIHPTQKPVALMEYMIKTYTHPGDVVLDNTMGSGTTGVACMNTGRRFIGIELDEGYFKIAKERIEAAMPIPEWLK